MGVVPAQPFALLYDPGTIRHFAAIERMHRSLILDSIESQLRFEPDVQSRNRKSLERPSPIGATWELRLRPHNSFRVFYRVNRLGHAVLILAIGVKVGNKLYIGGEEIEL
jgi:hypothetical protein